MVRYRDNTNQSYLNEHVGRCDREDSCGYHFTPKMFFEKYPTLNQKRINSFKPELIQKQQPIHYIEDSFLQKSMAHYDKNNFVSWLYTKFSSEIVSELISIYCIGTSKRWPGATAFFQINQHYKIRQVKVMLYHAETGKRVKSHETPFAGQSKIYFAGKSIFKKSGIESPNLKQCFFGEHLLKKHPSKIVGIVESEKTAIVLQAYALAGQAPDYVWLATGGKNGCRWNDAETFQVLKNRKVIFFPDLGAYTEWKNKVKLLVNPEMVVSEMLEKIASSEDRLQGLDIADYYLREWKTILVKNDFHSNAKFSIEDQEKLEKMKAINPLVEDLIKRFDLRSISS